MVSDDEFKSVWVFFILSRYPVSCLFFSCLMLNPSPQPLWSSLLPNSLASGEVVSGLYVGFFFFCYLPKFKILLKTWAFMEWDKFRF